MANGHRVQTTHPFNHSDGPFYDDPSDIGVHMENAIRNIEAGQPYITDVTLRYLEDESIARFAKQTGMKPIHEPDKRKNRAAWVSKWANEARHAQPHANTKNAIARASINVLLTTCELRGEIEANNNAQRIAALSMLLVCEVFMGGYMLDAEELRKSIKDIESAKERRYQKTIGAEAGDHERARNWCIGRAEKIWIENPARRIGNVSQELHKLLLENHDKLPTLDLTPKINTIKGWLKTAAVNGKLTIPEAAQKRGRPPNSGN